MDYLPQSISSCAMRQSLIPSQMKFFSRHLPSVHHISSFVHIFSREEYTVGMLNIWWKHIQFVRSFHNSHILTSIKIDQFLPHITSSAPSFLSQHWFVPSQTYCDFMHLLSEPRTLWQLNVSVLRHGTDSTTVVPIRKFLILIKHPIISNHRQIGVNGVWI